MSDAASGTYNAAPGNLSYSDMLPLEYSGASTALYVHFLPWFCMQPGSTATGPGTSCNSHIQVGYNSNDPATVKAQMSDMQSRGFQGPIVDWYGAGATIAEQTTQLVKSELEGRCSGSACPMSFAINEDQGSITRSCPLDGNGTDQTNCILDALNRDLDYMNANYFPSPAYLRVDSSTMSKSASGRPLVFFFICETCFTNPSPNWSYIWNQTRAHVLSYTSGDPLMWFIFRNSVGFTHTQADGAFAWINHYGSNDPYGLVYLDNFYDTSLKYRTLQPWGSAWKGFDNTNAPWHPAVSITPQQCGNTWLQTFAEVTHNNDYGVANQLPFLQVATWNDYEEGSEIETGIDNCLSISASISASTLQWTPTFSSASGTENTVDSYAVFSTTDGQNLTRVATVPAGTHAVPLSSLNLASGAQTLYVQAIGKASIQNKMSNAVPYSQLAISSVSPSSGTVAGGTAVTITGAGFVSGSTVSFGGTAAAVTSIAATSVKVTAPAHSAGAVDVVVSSPDGTSARAASAYTYIAPSFALSVSPSSQTITRGKTGSYTVTLSPKNGFTHTVSFSVTGLPSGATGSFSPTTVTTSGSTALKVTTTRTARTGSFKLTITGKDTSNGTTASTSANLTLR